MSKKDDKFLNSLERAVASVLTDPEAKVADKLKAIEAGAKIAMIRHRIEGAGDTDGGSFFAPTS